MAVLWCSPCSASVRDPRCRVLQYVHDFPMVGCLSYRSINPSRWVVAYGSKEDLIPYNVMVEFYLNDL